MGKRNEPASLSHVMDDLNIIHATYEYDEVAPKPDSCVPRG
jgi:hypothetical protein